MNLTLPLQLSYVQRLGFIIDIECTYGGYFGMETIKEIFFQYIFIFGVPTIYTLQL